MKLPANYILLILSILLLTFCKKKDSGNKPITEFNPTPYNLTIPDGFPEMLIPDDNPLTVEGVALGRMLYYDSILSGDNSQSCANCHTAAFAFSDNEKQFSTGIDGLQGNRNAPAVINVAWMPSLFWDGRAGSVEAQALAPVANPIEMHLSWAEAMSKLNNHKAYPELFFAAFGKSSIDSNMVVKAIAQFERTMISSNSRWDRYLRGELELTQSEAQGFDIFFTEKGDCFHCHGTILFTDNLFHNNGLDSLFADPGLFAVSGDQNDIGKFKAPSLRNLGFTSPYMHDGRFKTIVEVIDFYSEGVVWSPTIDPLMKKVNQGGIHLDQQQKHDLISFINMLNDSSFVNNPNFSNPF
jgi:cytochrome c peroxidase